ncbi:MAG: malate dehydrogenase [Nanoarchaeota archaeon]
MKKISIIGAGNVGASIAQLLLSKGGYDILLLDIVEGIPQGKALDLFHAIPLYQRGGTISGSNDFSKMQNSEIIVITAGLPRKPGMSRDDLLEKNTSIIRSVCQHIKQHAPDSIVIVVTNPLDTMTLVAQKTLGFPPKRVMGMAGTLDSARFKAFLAAELSISPDKIETLVLGGHGDAMVPLPEFTKIDGKPITALLDKEKMEELVNRTRNAGAEIVSHLKTGSAFYAPAAAVVEMIEQMENDEGTIVPVTAYLNSEFGYDGICLGVPVKLGKEGIKEVVELPLSEEAKRLLDVSAKAVIENKEKLGF